ncbi:MAG: phosphoglycerate kinase [Spirochaetes bacterium]|nr:phosphoglycerate kinase [Spirochaetota bacterium]
MAGKLRMRSIDEGDFKGKAVLLRVDINSPVDKQTKRIINDNRIRKSVPTIRDLSEQGAKLVLMSHQGDTTDYASLISMHEHAKRLSEALGKTVDFIEDIAGPAAAERIERLKDGDILLLDNLRYFTEEVSTFEDSVKLDPAGMGRAYLVRRLAPLFDCYVNDAFSAAHRNAPSMVAFQELLPSYGGRLLIGELGALQAITEDPERPCVFMLGGSRAGDAFGMIQRVLSDNSADAILTSGLVGQIFMLADGLSLGKASERVIEEKGYGRYIVEAAGYLSRYRNKIVYPRDVAFERHGSREEVQVDALPQDEMIFDIGKDTVSLFAIEIERSKTIFVNGPVGIYEDDISSTGTRNLWKVVEEANGFTVVGGGDTVTSFTNFTDTTKLNYVSTAGGALIRYLSGVRLPLLEAMGRAYDRV